MQLSQVPSTGFREQDVILLIAAPSKELQSLHTGVRKAGSGETRGSHTGQQPPQQVQKYRDRRLRP